MTPSCHRHPSAAARRLGLGSVTSTSEVQVRRLPAVRTTIVLGAAIVVASAAGPAGAITNDWVPDDVHDYVGLVVLLDEDGEFLSRCSGALIDDTTVLTAGHCTDGASSARIYFQQDAGANYDPETEQDPVSGYPDECAPGTLGVWCVESGSLYNAGFDEFASFPDTHDVGLVILDAPPSGVDGTGRAAGAAGPRPAGPRARAQPHGVHRQRLRAERVQPAARRELPVPADGELTPDEPAQLAERRVQRADERQRAGLRRDLLGRLGRAGVPRRRRERHDRRRHLVRAQLVVPGHRLQLSHRPGRGPGLDRRRLPGDGARAVRLDGRDGVSRGASRAARSWPRRPRGRDGRGGCGP